MAARNVYMLRPDGGSVSIDPLVVRPAWSTSWLTGAPSLHMDMTSPQGRVHGTMRIADDMAWDMRIDDLDLAHLPLALPDGVTISGLLAADVDLQTSAEDQSLAGQVVFEAHDGTLSHPLIPIEIDFSDVTGNVVLGGETLADIKDIQLDGSVIAAQLSGQVEPTSRRGQNPIKMNIDLQIKDPGMQNMLRSMGVRLDDQGRAVFRLGGSLQSPKPY
jgi:type II secretion system protein N